MDPAENLWDYVQRRGDQTKNANEQKALHLLPSKLGVVAA